MNFSKPPSTQKYEPTEEQRLVVQAAKETEDNLIISALAGAAKTSTLILIAEALKSTSILSLAFNKRIADEMVQRLPGNCTAMTLNGLGHRAWGQALGRKLLLNTKKTYEIVSALINELKGKDKSDAFASMADIMKAVDSGKSSGYIPSGHFGQAKRLMDDDSFYSWLDDEPSPLEWGIIREASLVSIRKAYQGEIDFNDQLLMSTVFPCVFAIFPLVLVDEAQDLSALNHAMLRKLAKKRIIAVGDECQAIYGFRGAHEESMDLLQKTFGMSRLILSTSFRCPIKIVEASRWRAPHMQYPAWAQEGSVNVLTEWDAQTVPDHSAILCRNNAPLFRTALRLLKAGRYPKLIGNDIGKSLVKVMKKFGPTSLPKEQVLASIDEWLVAKLAKSRAKGSANDQADCMRIFAEAGNDLGDALAYAEHLFNSNGPIQLSTIHKAKGLEYEHVYLLDRSLIRTDEGQEANLLYVAITRSKSTLTYIDTEDYVE